MNDTMKTGLDALVKRTFSDLVGSKAAEVTGFDGSAPSEQNLYLYNPMLQQFEGNVKDESGQNYTFFITKDKDGWEATFTPAK